MIVKDNVDTDDHQTLLLLTSSAWDAAAAAEPSSPSSALPSIFTLTTPDLSTMSWMLWPFLPIIFAAVQFIHQHVVTTSSIQAVHIFNICLSLYDSFTFFRPKNWQPFLDIVLKRWRPFFSNRRHSHPLRLLTDCFFSTLCKVQPQKNFSLSSGCHHLDGLIGLSKVQCPTRHILGHFGDDGVTAASARTVSLGADAPCPRLVKPLGPGQRV